MARFDVVHVNTGDASGGAGVATANADTVIPIKGLIEAIRVEYNGSPPATTDLVIKTKGANAAPGSNTIMTLTDAAADGWFYPRHVIHDDAGSPVASTYTRIAVHDIINVLIDQANDGDSADVWIVYEAR